MKDRSELVTVISPHLGSNGHEVSIHVFKHAHIDIAVAEVRTTQDKRFVLPQTSILNGLTSQPIRYRLRLAPYLLYCSDSREFCLLCISVG
jgi:hypothetical protein